MLKFFLFLLSALSLSAEVLLQNNFNSGLDNWNSPDYWNGTVSAVDGTLQLQSEERQGKTFCRALRPCKQLPWGGQILQITLRARGQGALRPGLILYYHGEDGKIDYGKIRYAFAETPAVLNPDFQKVEFTYPLGSDLPVMITPCLQLDGAGTAQADDFLFQTTVRPGAAMEALERHLVISGEAGNLPELHFRFSRPDHPVVLMHREVVLEKRSGPDGSFASGALPVSLGLHRITAAAEGAIANTYIDVLPPAEYAAMAALSDSIRLATPLRMLLIGDSLTDFDRGFNSIDKLDFWINRSNPGQFSCRNAAVRGDYILRVEERLQNKKAFQQQVYDRLFEQEYDLICLWLGHNDTRCDSKEEYRRPLVTPEEQEAAFRRVIALIRQHSQARIMLISPSPSNEALFLERVARKKPEERVIMFGKSEFVKGYDAVLRKLAAELQLGYYDMHQAMCQYPERAALYQADGVHLSDNGHRFAAQQLLQGIAGLLKK